jgi:Domain of unknown function (DUF397)
MERNIWRKAMASANNGGACVEVMITGSAVKVRDTKDGDSGPVHVYSHTEWSAFLDGVKKGEFDL